MSEGGASAGMNDWDVLMALGARQATEVVAVVAVLFGLRTVADWVRQRLPGWLQGRRAGETNRRPAGSPPAWANHLMGVLFAAWPFCLGISRLWRGRFTVWQTARRSHPNPPLYLYEGTPAVLYACGLILWGIAIYCAVAGWPSRRWRWLAVGVALLGLYGGFFLYAAARAGAQKML